MGTGRGRRAPRNDIRFSHYYYAEYLIVPTRNRRKKADITMQMPTFSHAFKMPYLYCCNSQLKVNLFPYIRFKL